jgi:hypothetical protein
MPAAAASRTTRATAGGHPAMIPPVTLWGKRRQSAVCRGRVLSVEGYSAQPLNIVMPETPK